MSEQIHHTPRHEQHNTNTSPEVERSQDKLHEAPKPNSEQLRREQESQQETARKTVEHEATSKQESTLPNEEKKAQPRYFTKTDRQRSFRLTMRHVRANMGQSQRTFSTLIHQPQIEKISNVTSKTIARPSGILGATSAALIGMGFILIIAKHTGFALAGSEFWVLLCGGYLIGLFIEAIQKVVRRKKT